MGSVCVVSSHLLTLQENMTLRHTLYAKDYEQLMELQAHDGLP